MDDASLSHERLIVLKQGNTFVVVHEDDPSDWLASFTQDEAFPAQEWAERMADLFNLRIVEDDSAEPHAPLFTGSHHPRKP
jgi:hypothetical protein